MTISFFTNLIHHHQVNVADEMYAVLGDNYRYVATEPLSDWLLRGGYAEIDRPYLVKAYESEENHRIAMDLGLKSDVVIIGQASDEFIRERLNQNKLTYRYSERILKKRQRLIDLRYLKKYYNKHTKWRKHNLYMLCASAYTPNDVRTIFAYPDKCLKWGYFTAVPELDMSSIQGVRRNVSTVKILWVARFLQLKHPERMLQLASLLRKDGYDDFVIDMVGSGEKHDAIKAQIEEQGLENYVKLIGNFPNDQIHLLMREHDIFCFTSDRNEGWGAVLNESMSDGCAVVASHAIGSVPFLIKNGVNGLIYKSHSSKELFEKVKFLIDNPEKREQLSISAYNTMHDLWSPKNAANKFLKLAESMLKGNPIEIAEGPCSKALPKNKNYYK